MPTKPRTPAQVNPRALVLRGGRMRAGLSQSQVARAIGVHVATIGHWERGRQPVTNPDTIAKLGNLYGIPPDVIATAGGELMPDMIAYLADHPHLVYAIRQQMRDARTK